MAVKVGQVVGFYSQVPANQAQSMGVGPYPAVVEGFYPDGRTMLWVFHLNAFSIIYQKGDKRLSVKWADYWDVLP